ncbi:MAG: DUF1643 domain-containing protein [Pseudomonadota bacterium]
MKQIYLHRPNLAINAEFSSEGTPIFRYRLEAIKDGALNNPKTVCAIMQNPSYAGIKVADKSVQVLERVVFEKKLTEFYGVERLIIVNQFAYIQTKDFVGNDNQVGERNDDEIIRAVNESEIILIAWGKDNGFIQRQKRILEIIRAQEGRTLLQTSRHPSRVIYDGFIQKYSA